MTVTQGVNFNRPGFQAMLAEAEAGKIGTIIVKDMSRFGRNYLEVGWFEKETTPQLLENHKAALIDMINRDKNHASVIAWSRMSPSVRARGPKPTSRRCLIWHMRSTPRSARAPMPS